MKPDFDIAIAGSGFGGSLLAMILRKLGRSVLLIERGRHPRFAIGESSTPLANLLLERIADQYGLSAVRPLSKWGAWQATYPQLACGLKRGFSFFHHNFETRWEPRSARDNELLVAASPHSGIADTHWYRPDFDQFLVSQAQMSGVEFFDQTTIDNIQFEPTQVRFSCSRLGRPSEVRARYFVDGTGPRGLLHQLLAIPEAPFSHFPSTRAIYAHFRGVGRWQEVSRHRIEEAPPFPVDDAALHHVFPGGWIWVLRFNNGIVSAGAALEANLASQLSTVRPQAAWEKLLSHLPSIRDQFGGADASTPFMHLPNLSFRTSCAAGERWVMLPSALGFIDPLLSTGFPLNLLGILRLADIFKKHWNTNLMGGALQEYTRASFRDLDAAAQLIGSLYRNFGRFDHFVALTMFYFAAASYSETRVRLEKGGESEAFLFSDRKSLYDQLMKSVHPPEIRQLIEPFNVAGLANPSSRNWYPLRQRDLFDNASKLGATHEEITSMLERSGFTE